MSKNESHEDVGHTTVAVQPADAVDNGARTVEATHKVYGKYSKWFLFIGLALAAYIYSLDGQTTSYYLTYAASSLGDHSLISSIQVAQSVIIAVFKPIVAKFADVTSRGIAYLIVLVFYVVGYIVIASAHNIGTVAGGIILYAVGYTGLQLLTQIIIADITTLKWRGLVSGLISLPFVINAWIGGDITGQMLENPTTGWRWGYGMFAILIPVSLAPLIITLLWAERKAKRLGIVASHAGASESMTFIKAIHAMDLVGLILIAASVALIVLPLTLAKTASGGWNNGSIIAMIVIGICLLPAFAIWDFKFAKYPVIPLRFVKHPAIMAASFIGFFDFVSFYLTFTYLYSFITVTKPWTVKNATYFVSTQSVALTVFGILAGVAMTFTRRYKWIVYSGLLIRLLGVGLMIHSRGAQGNTAELVWTQLLQGIGGGFAAISSQVGAQAGVKHADVAMVTAVVLLITEIGGAIGSGIAGAIWTNTMPGKLAIHLPDLSQEERDTLFASVITAAAKPLGDPTREGVIAAYSDVMLIMCIAATCIAVVPIALAFFLPDYYLGDKQNAVDEANLEGVEDTASVNSTTKKPAETSV